jgi:hypothetical protein
MMEYWNNGIIIIREQSSEMCVPARRQGVMEYWNKAGMGRRPSDK